MSRRNIVLTGFTGTGKSTIGKIIAQKLSMRFIDIDSEIERIEGINVNDIFARYGERYLRRLEEKIINDRLILDNVVIATGKGTMLDKDKVDIIREKGIVIHLKARPDVIVRNLSRGTKYSTYFSDEEIKKRVNEMLNKRREFYNSNDFEVDVSDMTPEEASEKIIRMVEINKEMKLCP